MTQSVELPYQAALLQFVPDPSSDERINVGVVILGQGAVQYRFSDRYGRLKSLTPFLDGRSYRALIRQLSSRAQSLVRRGRSDLQLPLERFESMEELLDEIVTPDSLNFAWSSHRFGVCTSLDERVQSLFQEYVGRYEARTGRDRRDDEAVWRAVVDAPSFQQISPEINHGVEVTSPDYRYVFRAGWVNGHLNVVEPISLDYLDPSQMVEEATRWRGRLEELSSAGTEFTMTAIVSDPPNGDGRQRYEQANHILLKDPRVRAVFRESEADVFVKFVEADLLRGHADGVQTA